MQDVELLINLLRITAINFRNLASNYIDAWLGADHLSV
jgi:hypothetical protein